MRASYPTWAPNNDSAMQTRDFGPHEPALRKQGDLSISFDRSRGLHGKLPIVLISPLRGGVINSEFSASYLYC